jgi:hypothetical protein
LHAVAQLADALCYQLEGRGFETRWNEYFLFSFQFTKSYQPQEPFVFTQPLTETDRNRKKNIYG